MGKDVGGLKTSIVLLWIFVLIGFGSAAYMFRKLEHLEARLTQCEGRDERFRADLSELGERHNETVKYLQEKEKSDAAMGLLSFLFGGL
jgi:hypothetical protein